MAQRVENFNFTRRGRRHDFTKYADGATWILVYGEDYDSKGSSIVTSARKWAEKNDLHVEYEILPPEGANPERVALRFTRVSSGNFVEPGAA